LADPTGAKLKGLEQDLKFHHERLNVVDRTQSKQDAMIRELTTLNIKEHDSLDKRITHAFDNLDTRLNTQAKAGLNTCTAIEELNFKVNKLQDSIKDWFNGRTSRTAGIGAAEQADARINFDASNFADKACEEQRSKRIPVSTLKSISELADKLEALIRSL
jgi:hypothetical protein